jgi:hypothetical protein
MSKHREIDVDANFSKLASKSIIVPITSGNLEAGPKNRYATRVKNQTVDLTFNDEEKSIV